MTARPCLTLLAAVLVALAAGGCLEYQNVITVNADGSGQLEVTVLYLPQTVKDLQLLAGEHAAAQDALAVFLCDEDQLRQDAKALGDDVRFKGVAPLTRADGARGFLATYTFSNINTVRLGKLVLGRREKPATTPFPVTEYRFALDRPAAPQPVTLKITAAGPQLAAKDAAARPRPAAVDGQLKTLRSVLRGYRATVQVRVTGKITDTTARHYAADTGTVTLLELDADRLLADTAAATAALQLGQDQAAALAALAAPGLKLEDLTQPLTIRFE